MSARAERASSGLWSFRFSGPTGNFLSPEVPILLLTPDPDGIPVPYLDGPDTGTFDHNDVDLVGLPVVSARNAQVRKQDSCVGTGRNDNPLFRRSRADHLPSVTGWQHRTTLTFIQASGMVSRSRGKPGFHPSSRLPRCMGMTGTALAPSPESTARDLCLNERLGPHTGNGTERDYVHPVSRLRG